MKLRAVLVGSYYGSKLYYLLEPYGDKNSTGALVDANGNIEYIKFFAFIKSNPGVREFRFSKFHRFLWDAPSPENKPKWKRIFVNGTQPVDEEMLIGAKIISDLGPQTKKKHLLEDRAIHFKSLVISQNVTSMPDSILSRRIESSRMKIGYKGIGRSIGNKPAIDGDGDGFVDDGLPTMRPFIPGFDFVLDAMGNVRESMTNARESVRGGMQSRILTKPQTIDERLFPLTETEVANVQRKMRAYVEKTFNDGKEFKTKREVMDVLARHIPSFASGDSYIQFLDEITNDDEVVPDWARQYLDAFLLSISAQPEAIKFNYRIEKAPDNKPYGGAVSIRSSAQDYVTDPTTGRFKPTKIRRPLIMFEYKEKQPGTPIKDFNNDSDRQAQSLFNIGSAIVDGIKAAKLKIANFNERTYQDLGNIERINRNIDAFEKTLTELASIAPNLVVLPDDEIIKAVGGFIAAISDVHPGRIDADPLTRVVRKIDWVPQTPQITFFNDKNKEQAFISRNIAKKFAEQLFGPRGFTHSELLQFVQDSRKDIYNQLHGDNKMRKVLRKIESIDSGLSELLGQTIALHESNHMLHNIQARIDAINQAELIRQAIVNREAEKFSSQGAEAYARYRALIQKQVRIEDFFGEVFTERAVQLARQDAVLAKRRLLHSDFYPMSDVQFPRLRQSQYNENESEFGWAAFDTVTAACMQMLDKFVTFAQNNSVLSDNQKKAKQSIRAFMTQPITTDSGNITIGDGLARVLNEINSAVGVLATTFSRNGVRFESGEELNLGMAVMLLHPTLLIENASTRNIFSGLKLRQYSALLEEVGFPDFIINDGNSIKKIQGLELDESKKLSTALLYIRGMAKEIPTLPDGSVPADLSVRATTAIEVPSKITLPSPFPPMTEKELMEMDDEKFLPLYKKMIENTLSLLESTTDSRTYETVVESGITDMYWWDNFTKEETDTLLKVMRGVGTPNIKQGRSGTGYTTYMGTITPPTFPGFACPPRFSEFFAELAVANTFGVPISMIDTEMDENGQTRTISRALSENEMQAVLKFFRWMYPNQFLSEKLEEIQ